MEMLILLTVTDEEVFESFEIYLTRFKAKELESAGVELQLSSYFSLFYQEDLIYALGLTLSTPV